MFAVQQMNFALTVEVRCDIGNPVCFVSRSVRGQDSTDKASAGFPRFRGADPMGLISLSHRGAEPTVPTHPKRGRAVHHQFPALSAYNGASHNRTCCTGPLPSRQPYPRRSLGPDTAHDQYKAARQTFGTFLVTSSLVAGYGVSQPARTL